MGSSVHNRSQPCASEVVLDLLVGLFADTVVLDGLVLVLVVQTAVFGTFNRVLKGLDVALDLL